MNKKVFGFQADTEVPIDISILGEPVNQDLADFAKDRYIDFDKVRIKNIKKKSQVNLPTIEYQKQTSV